MKRTILLFAAAAFMLNACSNNTTEQNTAASESSTTVSGASSDPDEAVITLSSGDDMKYSLTEIRVKEGQTVKLTLTHTGKIAKTAMGHNFVLLASGVSLTDFATAAIAAQATDYLPVGSEKDVIAHTKLIGGGESDSIEFIAPAKGTYEFLCSFPGHSALMKGSFIVE